ncbi:hypothetical protein SDJN02_04512, partial [Cucurbita argyrosperma subsp. argyrosperma]
MRLQAYYYWEFSSKHEDEDEFSFGDPFCGAPIRDPLVEDRGSVLFGVDEDDELIKTPSNVFSRMLHISPPTPTPTPTPTLTSSPSNFLIPSPLHISSPTKMHLENSVPPLSVLFLFRHVYFLGLHLGPAS